MKLLTKMQMINWHYFSNEIIDFKDINFLTGANSAGKSTIIDALQAALIGETRSSRFNRAAGKKSERTFRSYLVGTLGEDVSNGVKSLREGKDFTSYIATEFYDDVKNEYFCVGVTADVYHDGGEERKRWFILEDHIPSSQFIIDEKTTESSVFLKWCRQNYSGNKFQSFESVKEYNRNVLRRMNVFDNKVFTMLRKAIAFEPISNIEEFITTNICDIEANIDTLAMQENIKNYQNTEQQARITEQRLSALSKICAKYEDLQALRARKKLQNFFIDYGSYQSEQDKLDLAKAKSLELSQFIDDCDAKLKKLAEEAETLKAVGDRLNIEEAQFLSESRKDILELERVNVQKNIEEARSKEEKFINAVLTNTKTWIGKCEIMLGEVSEEQSASAIENLQKMLKRISHFSEQSIGNTSVKYFSDIKYAHERALSIAKPIAERYSEEKRNTSDRINRLQREIEILNSGRKPYPLNAEKLKSAIQKGLSGKYGRSITVDYLAELIDVTDDEWKNAVEGVLGNSRMNIIVSPKYFMDAYYIYKRVHRDLKVYEYSVVDLERVFNDQQTVKMNSLAQVVSCEDKYVRAYVDFLLGRVICCYDDEKIRDHHTSVTRDCMLYRGYAVRPINPFYYQTPYIGRRSIEEQLKQKNGELKLAQDELIKIGSHLRNANAFCNPNSPWFIDENFLEFGVKPAFEAYSHLLDLTGKLNKINDDLSKIDTAKLDEIVKAIKHNDDLQKANRKSENGFIEKRSTAANDNRRLCEQEIPTLEDSISTREKDIAQKYDEDFCVQKAIPDFEKRLSQYTTPEALADSFKSQVKGTETLIEKSKNALLEKRGDYNNAFHVSLNISDTETNEEFDKEHHRISEIELPAFAERITKAKETAMESFRSDFVNRLKNHIQSVIEQVKELNKALSKARFGNNTYKFEWKPNSDYYEYYEMIMSAEEGETLFSYDFQQKYKNTIENLFAQLEMLNGSDSAAAEAVDKLSRYSTYLSFDLLSIDANGITEKLSRTITAKSGGEIQTPFYVAMLASFAQLYKVNDTRNQTDNTMRLLIFDEAFNKMDPERIRESILMLRNFGLQAIICSPSDKAADISPLCDRTLLVDKQSDGKGGYRSTVIEWTKEMGEIKCDTEESL